MRKMLASAPSFFYTGRLVTGQCRFPLWLSREHHLCNRISPRHRQACLRPIEKFGIAFRVVSCYTIYINTSWHPSKYVASSLTGTVGRRCGRRWCFVLCGTIVCFRGRFHRIRGPLERKKCPRLPGQRKMPPDRRHIPGGKSVKQRNTA